MAQMYSAEEKYNIINASETYVYSCKNREKLYQNLKNISTNQGTL